jgi:hypothetical protein
MNGKWVWIAIEQNVLAICVDNVATSKYCRRLLHFEAGGRTVIRIHVAVVAAGRKLDFQPGNMRRE